MLLVLLPIMLCNSVVPKDVQENFISLRDRDFVGEDKRLRAALSRRLVLIQSGDNSSELLRPDSIGDRFERYSNVETDLQLDPDYLELIHTRKIPNNLRFNVSMDYAELFNFRLDPDGAFLASYGGDTTNLTDVLADLSRLSNLTGAGLIDSYNFSGLGDHLPGALAGNGSHNLTAGRRAEPSYWTHSEIDSNLHVLEIMKQNIYMIQERLRDLEPIIKKNEEDVRFRIAYVFNTIDEWLKDIRTIYYAMSRVRYYKWRVKKHLLYYEHVLRKNIDITYSVELVIHMHVNFMARMNEIVPAEQRKALKEMNKQKDAMAKLNQSTIDMIKRNQSGQKPGRRTLTRLPQS